LFKLNNFAGIF